MPLAITRPRPGARTVVVGAATALLGRSRADPAASPSGAGPAAAGRCVGVDAQQLFRRSCRSGFPAGIRSRRSRRRQTGRSCQPEYASSPRRAAVAVRTVANGLSQEPMRGVAEIQFIVVHAGPTVPQPAGEIAANRGGQHRHHDQIDSGPEIKSGARHALVAPRRNHRVALGLPMPRPAGPASPLPRRGRRRAPRPRRMRGGSRPLIDHRTRRDWHRHAIASGSVLIGHALGNLPHGPS